VEEKKFIYSTARRCYFVGFYVFEIGAIDVLESKGERWFEEL